MSDTEIAVSADDAVVRITITRPAVRNCLSEDVIAGLEKGLDLAEQRHAKVIVLRGAGRNFCAGVDLSVVTSLIDDGAGFQAFIGRLVAIADRLERGPFASLAVVEGFALAGGFELLLACDMSLAADDARIGDCHLEYALAPGAGASVRLPRTLTKARAHYLLLSGQPVTGATAADWGLVTKALPTDELEAEAERLVERLASRSGDALRVVKAMALDGVGGTVADGMAAEASRFFGHLQNSPDVREGLAAFTERRAPCYRS